MAEPLTSIRNIGPAMADALRRAGIGTAEDLRTLGSDAAYLRLLEAGHRPHFIAYRAIELGLQGRPWTDCAGPEKAALRRRFDALKAGALKAGATPPVRSELEAALDALGIIDRRPRRFTAPERTAPITKPIAEAALITSQRMMKITTPTIAIVVY